MEKDWVCIFSTNMLHQAEIGKNLLHDNDIEVVVINKKDSMNLIGAYEIYVKRDDVIRGKHVLKEMD